MSGPSGEEPAGSEKERWPVGLILLIVAAALYLLVRLIQGIGWVVDRVAG